MDEDSSQRMVFSQTRPGSVNAKASGVSKPSGQEDQEQSDHESPRSRTSPRELGRQEFVLEEAPHSSCERRARNSRLDDHLGPQSVNSSILAIRSQQTSLMLVLNDVLRSGSSPGTQDMTRSHSCTRSEEICHRTPLPTFEPTKRQPCQDRDIELQELPKRALRSHRPTESCIKA